jgi:hypothetical protein
MDIQPGAVRQLSDRMLMLLLKQLAPEKYGSMAPLGGKRKVES